MALTRSIWRPGRSSEVRDAASPLISADSPTARMTTSDSRAARTASAMPSVPSLFDVAAFRISNFVLPETFALIPASSVTASSFLPSPVHEPIMIQLIVRERTDHRN